VPDAPAPLGGECAINIAESKDSKFVVLVLLTPICVVNIPLAPEIAKSVAEALKQCAEKLGNKIIVPDATLVKKVDFGSGSVPQAH
jgi:hypothetical protein